MVVRGGARVATTIPRGSLLGPDPHCRRPRTSGWVGGIHSFRAWYCGTGRLAAIERRYDSSRTRRMEAVANAASDLGRDAGRFLGSYRLVLDHGERTRCGSDADTAPTRSNLRRNVQRQSAITIFQFAFGRWRCARSYHLAYRRGRNHRLAGLRLHWPGRAAPIVVQCRSDLVV